MKMSATLPAVATSGGQTLPRPIVFIDGVPEPRLTVVTCSAEAPLDTRTITLDAGVAIGRPGLWRRWQHAKAVIAQPMRLVDEQVRWKVLAAGVIDEGERASSAGVERRQLTLRDAWTDQLARRLDQVWWSEGDGALVAQSTGRLKAGGDGNRSQQTYRFAGQDVHVLREAGEPWTLGAALAAVNAWAGLELSLALLPRAIRRAPLTQSVTLSLPVGEVLRRLLEPYALIVQREGLLEGEMVIERRAVRPTAQGRIVPLSGGLVDSPGQVTASRGEEPSDAAEPWVAQAAGWRVESTFDMVPGWHPALEGEADDAYGRTTSEDFARYGNVYRYWVLNEDGRFTSAPYHRGPAFDLASFFGDGGMRAQALPFRSCVTLDDAGEPRPAVVQVSVDAGGTWQQYPGRAVLASHRAAVYLDDDVLPGTVLAAAKAGEARVRVTASLQSPQAVTTVRWRGNPFAGAKPTRVFELGETFRFQRVASTSIHKSAIVAGELVADESDPQQAMSQWLVERMEEDGQHRSANRAARQRMTLAGVWLGLQVGDVLQQTSESTNAVVGSISQNMRVHHLHHRFDRAVTELDVRIV